MQNEIIDIKDAQTNFKDLLERVCGGLHVILSENDKPIAHLWPVTARVAGLHAGSIWTSDDFDSPMSDEFWTEEK